MSKIRDKFREKHSVDIVQAVLARQLALPFHGRLHLALRILRGVKE